MKSDMMTPGGTLTFLPALHGERKRVTCVTTPPRVDLSGLQVTRSGPLPFPLKRWIALWPPGHKANKAAGVPALAPRAVCANMTPSPASGRSSRTLWNSLASFIHWALNSPSPGPHSSPWRLQLLQCFLGQEERSSAQGRFPASCGSVPPLRLTQLAELSWTWRHCELVRTSRALSSGSGPGPLSALGHDNDLFGLQSLIHGKWRWEFLPSQDLRQCQERTRQVGPHRTALSLSSSLSQTLSWIQRISFSYHSQ